MIARSRSESGVTILELVMSITLISIVSAVFLPVLDTATRSVRPLQAQSVAVDDLRSSLAMIGRELRSALCITQPSANGPSGNVLRFTTEANDQQYEVTYTVTNGTLLRQVTNQSQVILVGTGLTGQGAAFTYNLPVWKNRIDLNAELFGGYYHSAPLPSEARAPLELLGGVIIHATHDWSVYGGVFGDPR